MSSVAHSINVSNVIVHARTHDCSLFKTHPGTMRDVWCIPAPLAAPWAKSELRLSIILSACQLAFLPTPLFFPLVFYLAALHLTREFLPLLPSPLRRTLRAASIDLARGRTHNSASGALFQACIFQREDWSLSLSMSISVFLSHSSKNFIEWNKQRKEDSRKRWVKERKREEERHEARRSAFAAGSNWEIQARNIGSGIKELHTPTGLEQQEIREFATLMVWFQSMELSEGHQSWSSDHTSVVKSPTRCRLYQFAGKSSVFLRTAQGRACYHQQTSRVLLFPGSLHASPKQQDRIGIKQRSTGSHLVLSGTSRGQLWDSAAPSHGDGFVKLKPSH